MEQKTNLENMLKHRMQIKKCVFDILKDAGFTVKNEEELSGYFIFDFGEKSVYHFNIKEIKNDYKLNSYDTFMIKNAKYNNITNFKMVLFLSEINDVDNYESILALTRFKNIVSALQYKYGLK